MDKKKSYKWIELICVCALSLLVVFGVTCGIGTLFSGWHFVDDHEFLEYSYLFNYKNMSLMDVIKDVDRVSFISRNNLLYYPTRIIMTYIIGADVVALSVIKAVETAIAMILLYYCGKELIITDSKAPCSTKEALKNGVVAFFFSLVCLVGFQAPVWWKLGPEQMQALLCFGIAFLCLLKWEKNEEKIAYGIVGTIFAVLMGFFHESFFLVMPFLALWPVYENIRRIRNSGAETTLTFDKDLKKLLDKYCGKKLWYVVAVMLLCVGIILSTVIRLGFNSYSPVGFDSSSSIGSYFRAFIYSMNHDCKWYKVFGILLIGVLLTYYNEFKRYWAELAITIVFMLPQFVLYSKEGIEERYLLPVVIGFAMFFVIFVYNSKLLAGGRKKVYIAISVMMLLFNAHSMVVEGDYYRFRGESVTKSLEEIESLSDRGYNVMCCFGICNPEADWTVDMYLKAHGKKDIYYWSEGAGFISTERPFFIDGTDSGLTVQDMDVIYMYNRNDRHFEIEPSIDLEGFTCVKSGSVDVYFKDSVLDELGQEEIDGLKIRPTIYGIGK